MLVPKLRFPGFKSEWRTTRLGEVSDRVVRKNIIGNKNILTISARHGLISQEVFFSKVVASSNLLNYYLLEDGDFVYNKSYSSGYPMGAIKQLSGDKGVVSPLYICFRPSSEINSSFLRCYFEGGHQNSELYKVAQEGVRNHGLLNIAVSDFFGIKITMPSVKPEQEKIADFLTAVDERIELQSHKVKKLETYRRGLTQKIFTRTLRFRRDDGSDFPEWKKKKLGDIATVKTGNLNVQDADEAARYIFFDRSEEIKRYREYSFNKEALIYPGEGAKFLPRYFNGKFGLHQRAYAIFDTDGILTKFLYYYLLTKNNHFISTAVGTTVKSLRMNCFEGCPVVVPTLDEQQKIATFFSQIDEKITLETEKLEGLKKFKKSLLQRMFV